MYATRCALVLAALLWSLPHASTLKVVRHDDEEEAFLRSQPQTSAAEAVLHIVDDVIVTDAKPGTPATGLPLCKLGEWNDGQWRQTGPIILDGFYCYSTLFGQDTGRMVENQLIKPGLFYIQDEQSAKHPDFANNTQFYEFLSAEQTHGMVGPMFVEARIMIALNETEEMKYPQAQVSAGPSCWRNWDYDCMGTDDHPEFERIYKDPMTFRWIPNTCSMDLFDGGALCWYLQGRRVLFVGDTVAEQTWTNIRNRMMGYHAPCWRDVQFVRNDRLDLRGENQSDSKNRHWYSRKDVDIFVLSFGTRPQNMSNPHDKPDAEVLQGIAAWMKDVVATRPGTRVIWRSHMPAHYKCEEAHEPGRAPPFPVDCDPQDSDCEIYRYWSRFEDMNRKAEEMFKGIPNVSVLDVFNVMRSRWDGHPSSGCGGKISTTVHFETPGFVETHYGDCLHWSQPGPSSALADALFHMIAHDVW